MEYYIFEDIDQMLSEILIDNWIETKTNSFYKKMSWFYSIRLSDHPPYKRTIITYDMINDGNYLFFHGSLKTGYSIYKSYLPNYEYFLDLKWSKIKNPIKNKPRLIKVENCGLKIIKIN